MADTQQLPEDRKQTIHGQELCVGDTCETQGVGEVAPKSDGSVEYEKGKQFRSEENYPEAIKWFELAFALGNIDAMVALGKVYNKGTGVEKSFEKAKYYYDEAIKAGSAYAEYKLGNLYKEWDGHEQDLSAALYHYIQSAEKGSKWGAFWAGVIYYEGKIVTKNYAKAVHYLVQASEAEVLVTRLVTIYQQGGYGIEKDNEKALYYANLALEQLKTRTNENTIVTTEKALSHYLLSIAIDFDKEDNQSKAIMLSEQVLSFKHVYPAVFCSASIMLGGIHYYGKGVERDFAKSFKYYEAASKIEDCDHYFLGEIQITVGRMLFIGRGIERDVDKAFELFEIAYNLGSEKAANTLCAIHINGYEVEKNFNKAIPYCEKARGENECSGTLGNLYYYTKQYEKALQCFKNEAEKETAGSRSAFAIAVMYVNGEGVERNFDLAKEWIKKSDEVFKEQFLGLTDGAARMLHDSGGTEYRISIIDDEPIYILGHMGLTLEEESRFFNNLDDTGLNVEQLVQTLGSMDSTAEEQ